MRRISEVGRVDRIGGVGGVSEARSEKRTMVWHILAWWLSSPNENPKDFLLHVNFPDDRQ